MDLIIRWRYIIIITILYKTIIQSNCQQAEDTTQIEYSISSSSSSNINSSSASRRSSNHSGIIEMSPEVAALAFDANNHSREALSRESSEHQSVLFIGDTSGYVPVHALRGQNLPTITGGGDVVVDDDEEDGDVDWHHPIDTWEREYRRFRFNTTRVQHIEAECQDDYMKIRIGFNGTFSGLVYSAGYAYDPDCMYINGTGRDYYEFYIQLNRCGTLGKNTHNEDNRKAPTKNFMWNTVTVQYNPLIEEEYDEHFKVTCEYGYDFWKTVTFPFLDVEVATGNPVVFTLTPPECYMEIRYGYGTGGNRVTGPVRVGDPLTLIIYMRSKYDGFDIVVNDCYAHNGATKKIQLIDEYGCPVDDKLISRFRGSWSEAGIYETQVFAYMKTFRFTGSPALYIECDVRMCHGRCPSQPCHWRNVKNIRKRSLPSSPSTSSSSSTSTTTTTTTTTTTSTTLKPNPSLSENVNLFQSLRVLQEGENDDEERNSTLTDYYRMDPNSVCLKTGWFSALLALGGGAMCLLGGALLATCTRMRKVAIDKVLTNAQFNGYMNHKGSIN